MQASLVILTVIDLNVTVCLGENPAMHSSCESILGAGLFPGMCEKSTKRLQENHWLAL